MTTTKRLESTVQPAKDQVTASAILMTGAFTGIGRATALAFAREGHVSLPYLTGTSLAVDGGKLTH